MKYTSKPLVYIAGPYTKPDPVSNTRKAIDLYIEMIKEGRCVPFCPHLSMLADLREHLPYQTWLDYDLEVIQHCDAILRMPGESAGADKEVQAASDYQIPVFTSKEALYAWI